MFSVIGLKEAHEATQGWNHRTKAPDRTTSERTSKWAEPAKNILKRNSGTNYPGDTEQIPFAKGSQGWAGYCTAGPLTFVAPQASSCAVGPQGMVKVNIDAALQRTRDGDCSSTRRDRNVSGGFLIFLK